MDEQSASSLLSFVDAEAGLAKPTVLREEIRKACRDSKNFWDKALPFLTPPGVCGSSAFDHAKVMFDLLDWDAKHNNKRIAAFHVVPRVLWNHFYAVVGQVLDTSHGRLIGVKEKPKGEGGTDNGSSGDIE
jgi:hypothetical protein